MNQSSERPNYAQLFPENPHETVRFGAASDCRKADFKTKPNFCATLATPVLVIQPQRQPSAQIQNQTQFLSRSGSLNNARRNQNANQTQFGAPRPDQDPTSAPGRRCYDEG